jgi:extradiol dioxygenase family protein
MSQLNNLRPFHLAVPVHNLEECREFYRNVLKMEEGRSDKKWVDFNFYGHQFVIHETGQKSNLKNNHVDGHGVPVPHFGVVLTMGDWKSLAESLKKVKIDFIIDPYIRFKGEPGEQATMFFLDPSGNAIEFKAFQNLNNLFTK